jgi:energy-converting hydrogenase Eha subunit F
MEIFSCLRTFASTFIIGVVLTMGLLAPACVNVSQTFPEQLGQTYMFGIRAAALDYP